MTKLPRAQEAVADKQVRRKFPFIGVGWAIVGVSSVTIALCVAAGATDVLNGKLQVEQKTSHAGSHGVQPATVGKAKNLADKYGAVAHSPTVAAAIARAEALGGVEKLERAAGAKAAADREEALGNGHWLPGTDQTSILMHGYVPPGMSQEQAAMLSRGLPKLPVMPRVGPITPEMADRMAGMPPEPGAGLPGVQADNQQIYESYMRQRFGPVSLPPLHRGHNVAPVFKVSDGIAHRTDNQMSLIQPEYNYDGGNGPASIRELTDSSGNLVAAYGYDPYGRQTKISGTGVDADFGYAGYYVHQRSGLNLTVHRAYSPSLGRWLSRDPIGEKGGTNLYAYVRNNPISYFDPLGLDIAPPSSPVCNNDLYDKCVQNCIRKWGHLGGLAVNTCIVNECQKYLDDHPQDDPEEKSPAKKRGVFSIVAK